MIRAVFFDLYETLITEWENGKRKTTHSIEQLGIPEDIFKKEWSDRIERRMDGTFENYQSVLKDILQSLKMPIDEKVLKLVELGRIKAKSIPFQDINQSILDALSLLKEIGVRIGLISNCTPEEITAWESSKLAKFFDDVIFSFEAKCAKPDPKIYLTACKNLGVKPKDALFIGDGGSNELVGAAKVGLNAYHATWFQPQWIVEDRNLGFPQLKHPTEIIKLIEGELT